MNSAVAVDRPMHNSLGAAGLVFGIISLFFAPVTFIGVWFVAVFAFGVPLAGVLMSAYGLERTYKGLATNRGIAVAGVVLNSLALVIANLAVVGSLVSYMIGSSGA